MSGSDVQINHDRKTGDGVGSCTGMGPVSHHRGCPGRRRGAAASRPRDTGDGRTGRDPAQVRRVVRPIAPAGCESTRCMDGEVLMSERNDDHGKCVTNIGRLGLSSQRHGKAAMTRRIIGACTCIVVASAHLLNAQDRSRERSRRQAGGSGKGQTREQGRFQTVT